MTVVPFLDLGAQYAQVGDALEKAVVAVLRSGAYVLGPDVAQFEQEFAQACGAAHAVGTSTGTSALWAALKAVDVGPGDEVITSPSTFVATVAAIVAVGAKPVLVDIDPGTWTIDPRLAEAAVTDRTKVVLPVHLHGRAADLGALRALCDRRGLRLIEDAAQAHLARSGGRLCGSVGDLACFSFYPGKNLGSVGEGGAVTTGDEALARRVRMFRDWGAERKYHHELPGSNERLQSVQAAALRVKLPFLEQWTTLRSERAERYGELLAGLPITLPAEVPAGDRHAWHVYAVRLKERDRVQSALHDRGIQTGIHYPVPVHLQPAYPGLGGIGSFPNAESLAAETLSLPLFPELSDAQQDRVVAALTEVLHG